MQRFYGITVFYAADDSPKSLDLYKAIRSDVKQKYGETDYDVESYKRPYEEGDGHEYTAIRLGFATIGALWQFPRGDKNATEGSIMLDIDKDLTITLNYRDGEIYREVLKEKESKANADY